MKRRAFFTIVAFVVAFGLGGAMAYAQSAVAEIPFAFVAGGKELPAGKYQVADASNFRLQFTGPTGEGFFLTAVTMLGRHDKDPDPEFVFDKVDGKAVLSEIWMPGKDGYLFVATNKPHTHAVVGGSNPRK
jgi:hypothetical protein